VYFLCYILTYELHMPYSDFQVPYSDVCGFHVPYSDLCEIHVPHCGTCFLHALLSSMCTIMSANAACLLQDSCASAPSLSFTRMHDAWNLSTCVAPPCCRYLWCTSSEALALQTRFACLRCVDIHSSVSWGASHPVSDLPLTCGRQCVCLSGNVRRIDLWGVSVSVSVRPRCPFINSPHHK
jgi:hypothetical protein